MAGTDLRPWFSAADARVKLSWFIALSGVVMVPSLEPNKSLDGCAALMSELVRRRVRRDFTLVALGGGIVQDVTAFSASVLYRGIKWAFVPTTLRYSSMPLGYILRKPRPKVCSGRMLLLAE